MSLPSAPSPSTSSIPQPTPTSADPVSSWAHKYRGAVVADLDPPAALSISPDAPISHALITAFEREYTHLTITSSRDRALLGYISIPRLRALLDSGSVSEADPVRKAMLRFRREKGSYKFIGMETPLEELEGFFEGVGGGERQDFAVVTDAGRRFVLGVATREDLSEFVRRRPA